VTLTLKSKPEDATHWSTRSLAKKVGLTQNAIFRIGRALACNLTVVRSFKLSTDPLFAEKVRDIVGLYMSPPDKAFRSVRGREVADSGTRPDAAAAADASKSA